MQKMCFCLCVLAQSVERPPHNREVVGSIPGRVIPKDVKRWGCCYPVWRSTFERDRATSIWRCSVAAGPTINWAKRFSISDNKIIIIIIILLKLSW